MPVSTFKDGLALVSTKDSLLVIDTLGKTVYSTPVPASGAAALLKAWG